MDSCDTLLNTCTREKHGTESRSLTDAVKHHHLPQYHLRSFKIKPQRTRFPRVVVIEKSVDARHFEAAIHDIGCVRDYNTIDMEGSPRDRNTVEKVLSHVEN